MRSSVRLWASIFSFTILAFAGRSNAAADAHSLLDSLASIDLAEGQSALKAFHSTLLIDSSALLRTDDADSLSKISEVLQFNQRLDAWLLQVATLPADVRSKQLDLLNKHALLPILNKVFSPDPQSRIDGFRYLAAARDIDADPLLIYSLRDESAGVAFGTFNILWDRSPSTQIVDALWQLGFRDGFEAAMHPPHRRAGETTTFHGITVSVEAPATYPLGWDLRSKAARDILGHIQSSRLESLANGMLDDVAAQLGSRKGGNLDRLGIPLGTLCMLISDNRYLSAIPHLQKLLAFPTEFLEETLLVSVGPDPTNVYISIRTQALATIVLLTKQSPADYSLVRVSEGASWYSRSKEDEVSAVDRLNDWWKQHASQFTTSASANAK